MAQEELRGTWTMTADGTLYSGSVMSDGSSQANLMVMVRHLEGPEPFMTFRVQGGPDNVRFEDRGNGLFIGSIGPAVEQVAPFTDPWARVEVVAAEISLAVFDVTLSLSGPTELVDPDRVMMDPLPVFFEDGRSRIALPPAWRPPTGGEESGS